MTTTISRTLIAAAVALAAGGAQAATMTLSGWTWGKGNQVSTAAPTFNGHAGGFSGTLAGAPGFDGPIQTYCVELDQFFTFKQSYGNYSVVGAESHFGAAKTDTLARLLSHVMDGNLIGSAAASQRDDLSTSLQLAIWNVVYDTDMTLAASTGSAFNDTSTFAAGANSMLSGSMGAARTLDLFVLVSPTQQDQLFWRAASQVVPEPGSLALAGLALAGLVAARRRRG